MILEDKFLFVSRVFLLTFIVLNSINLFPVKFFDIFYYSNFFSLALDTTTLLLLSLSIEKYLYIRKINILQTQIESNPSESDLINNKLLHFQRKNNSNVVFSKFWTLFFVLVIIFQPINFLFLLNKHDLYTSQALNTITAKFNVERNALEQSLITKENVESSDLNDFKNNIYEKINNLNLLEENNVKNFLKENNKRKYYEIKFLVRNFFLAIVWAFAFYRLSII